MSYPSIFNDVLGPVMRGPSSSHCAASLRIGRICRDLMGGQIEQVIITYDPNGSLATTHKSQGSDMGLFGGFLGWEAYDERLPDYQQGIQEAGIEIDICIEDIQAEHPNTYQIKLSNAQETRRLVALSTGGGMIEVISIDGAPVSMYGDYYETLIYVSSPGKVKEYLAASVECDEIELREGRDTYFEIKSQDFLPQQILEELEGMEEVRFIKQLHPVLPILSRKELNIPFLTCEDMLAYNPG